MVGGRYRIYVGDAIVEASLRGRFKQQSKQRVLVGDRVAFTGGGEEGMTIERILPRTNVLRRRMPGGGRGTRHVAANVDHVVVVGAAARPDWNPHLIDRFLAVAAVNEIPAVVVVNKIDLDPEARTCGEPYGQAGYAVIFTSVKTGVGIDELREVLGQHVTLFTGATGVGKSSLLNCIEPSLELRTGKVSEKRGAGRHTTVAAEMHPLGDGGFVVDTPGLRDIGLWGINARDVTKAFPEFAPYAERCRFHDCRHRHEPGCAVVEAVAEGKVAEGRLESYRRFLEEVEEVPRW